MTCDNMTNARMVLCKEMKPAKLFLLLKLIAIGNIIIPQRLRDGIDDEKIIVCTLTDKILLTATVFHIRGNNFS